MTICPRCGKSMPDERIRHALSRVDNKTYICAPCGTREAIESFLLPDNGKTSDKEWWIHTGKEPDEVD